MYKVSVLGGAPTPLSPASTASQGASWGTDGNIIASFSPITPLSRVPAAGGRAQPLTKFAPGETAHRWPQVLPGGSVVLFTAAITSTTMSAASIQAVSLKT